MKKLEKLKIEQCLSECLTMIPESTKLMINRFYMREIESIERYGKPNDDVEADSFERLRKLLEVVEDGNQEA